jgi:hypothetical protein
MSEPLLGIYFSVWTHQRCSLDDLAPIVAQATGCALSQSTDPGIIGDYVGESFGMHLYLQVSGSNITWTDISGYVAQLMTQRTGMIWSWTGSTVSDGTQSSS